MNRRQLLITSLAGVGLAAIDGMDAQGQTSGQCCIEQIRKEFTGRHSARLGAFYLCPGGKKTAQDPTVFHLDLKSSGSPCDAAALSVNRLEAQGTTVRREDALALFSGNFQLYRNLQLRFQGEMYATYRIGTHDSPFGAEACDVQNHLEGWLEGTGVGDFFTYRLRAFLVATDKLPQPGVPTTTTDLRGTIHGVLLRCL